MLKNKMNLMLNSLINDKKAFKEFYKDGFFSYDDEKKIIGEVAILNPKAVISFLQDASKESNIIATMAFSNGRTIIFEISDNNFQQFGQPSITSDMLAGMAAHACKVDFDSVSHNVEDIINNCSQAKEKMVQEKQKPFIKRVIKQLTTTKECLSKQEVQSLIEQTLDKLSRAQDFSKREKISPKVKGLANEVDYNLSTAKSEKSTSYIDQTR